MLHDFYIALMSDNSLNEYNTNTLSSFTNKLAKPIEFNSDDWRVGIVQYDSSIYNSTDLAFIYTDFIQPQCIGDTMSRYLRILPICHNALLNMKETDEDKSQRISYTFRQIQYVPIEQRYLESISIVIANKLGEQIELNDSTIPTYILLHFKRVTL